MVSILYKAILDTEVFDHHTEKCFLAAMDPYSGCVFHGMIPKWSYMFHQLLVSGENPGLFEDIHVLLYAHVYPPLVVNQCLEVISIDDLLWDDFQRNPHKRRVW